MTKIRLEVEIDGERAEARRALSAAIDADVFQQSVSESDEVFVDSMSISDEAEVRRELTRFTVEVEIDGDRNAAAEAVDDALDDGVLQDAIREQGDVTVESAVVVFEQR